MPFINVILQIVEYSWNLSVAVLPVLFTVFGLVAVVSGGRAAVNGNGERFVRLVVASQRDLVEQYGPHLVAGLVLGGALNSVFVGESVLPGAILALLVLAYAHRALPVQQYELALESVKTYVYTAVWFVLPVFSLVALVSMDVLLQSVVALVFYTALFWRI